MLSKNLQCNVYDQKQYNWLQCCIESQCYYCWDVKWFHIYCHNIPLRCIRTFYCIPYLLFSYLGVIKQPLNSFDSGIDTRLKDACIHSPSLLTSLVWFIEYDVFPWGFLDYYKTINHRSPFDCELKLITMEATISIRNRKETPLKWFMKLLWDVSYTHSLAVQQCSVQ